MPDSYEVSKNREALEEEIRRRAKAPVVSVRSQNDLGDCVFMDERIAIRPLVKHLIEEHGIRRFAYLAGAIEAINAGYAPSFATDGVARGTTAIRAPVSRSVNMEQGPKLRFADQKLFIENGGKRYDLRGHRLH